MRIRAAALSASLLLVSAACGFAERPATIYTIDDQKLMVKMLDESFAVKTAYGVVTVPAADVKAIWPAEKVSQQDVLATKGGDFRGSFDFAGVRTEGTLGKVTLRNGDIRVVQFDEGEPAAPEAVPSYGPMKGKEPEVELMAMDETRMTGTLEAAGVEIDTGYGKLTAPAKELISVTLGNPDEVVTRSGTIRGVVNIAGLSVKTRFGSVKVERPNIVKLKVEITEPDWPLSTKPLPASGIRSGDWAEIFNGKSVKGYFFWNSKPRAPVDGTLRFSGNDVVTWSVERGLADVAVKGSAKIAPPCADGTGIELLIGVSGLGEYYCVVGGKKGVIGRWDPHAEESRKTVILKVCEVDAPPGEWHVIEFRLLRKKLSLVVNGKLVAEAETDCEIPPGPVGFGAGGGDVVFRAVQVRTLR